MLTIHLRINDAATGKPTPVRLRISGPDGTTYAPFGRFAEFPTGRNEEVGGHLRLGRESWCYIDGSCEVKLPAGVPLRVRATKGLEYAPLDQTVTLGQGQMALRFTLERGTNFAAEGWVSGDTRCHFIPPHAALLEAAGEDLAVVNLLARQMPMLGHEGTSYVTAPHMIAFSGQAPALEADGRMVVVNTLNTHAVLGSVGLLNSHRPVFPLAFGEPHDTDDWSLCDWCHQCHRKGGLAVWVDAFRPTAGLLGGEALVAAVLRKIDAIEFDDLPRTQPLLPWLYRLWNAGFPIPLVGGSGKDSNKVPLGAMRTYAHVQASPERERGEAYRDWIEAIRAGRSFVTNGPLLRFTLTERDSGGAAQIEASVESFAPFEKLQVVMNGDVIADATGTSRASIAHSQPLDAPAWFAVRCTGPDGFFAHTSPVVVRVNGQAPQDRAALLALTRLIEQTRGWVAEHGHFANPKAKQHLLDLCDTTLIQLGGKQDLPG